MNLWGYWTSNGLGFHEYLQLCEDLGADALWVCNPGFSDNYRHAEYAPPEQVKDFVQEALDALEYALGPADSKWGAQRAANGHPAPFPLRYIEIGNEASGSGLSHQLPAVLRGDPREVSVAHHHQQPAAQGWRAGGDGGRPQIRHARIVLQRPRQIRHRRPQRPEGLCRRIRLHAAASAKATCIGRLGRGRLPARPRTQQRRGRDELPTRRLFFHVNDIAWPVNLIGFDNARVVRRSSYHVQQMLAANRPGVVLPTRVDPAVAPKDSELFALAGLDQPSGEIILKIVNRATAPREVTIQLNGAAPLAGKARMITLAHDDPMAENSLDDPEVIVPRESIRDLPGAEFTHTLPANSLTVMRLAPQAPTE